MDLSTAENTAIRSEGEKPGFLKQWLTDPDLELEATFGKGGVVDIQTFLNVINYLQKVRKLTFVAPVEYLTIGVDFPVSQTEKEPHRFVIEGSKNIERYCRSNKLQPDNFSCERKIKSKKNSVTLDEYNVKLKSAQEKPVNQDEQNVKTMIAYWSTYEKYFRIIKRWSFVDEKRNVRYDLSMVRSTDTAPFKRKDGTLGKKNPVYKFKDQPILEHAPRYEIEVELIDSTTVSRGDRNVEGTFKELMYSIVDVLRAIQGSNQLIKESEKNAVREAYATLTAEYQPKPKESNMSKPVGFIGFNPVTLKLENVGTERLPGYPNIRSVMEKGKTVGYYNVTDKADGLRCFGYTSPTGDFYLIDMSLNIYKTGLRNDSGKNSLIDGEFITKAHHKDNKSLDTLYVFDYYIGSGGDKKVRDLPFYDGTANCRHAKLEEWMADLVAANAGSKAPKFAVQLKGFEFASALDGEENIFSKAARIWSQKDSKPYHTDGLIFTPNLSSLSSGGSGKLRWNEQFKWKPSDQNTIDFLVIFDKDEFGRTIFTEVKDQQLVQHRRLRLLVMSEKFQNLRELYLSSDSLNFLKDSKYRPVLFNPMDPSDLEASKCRIELYSDTTTEDGKDYKDYIVCEGSEEVLYDNTVVEMAYDIKRPKGWQWYPMRVRQDKTERYRRAIAERKPMSRVMNDANTANDVWNSIHNPVTDEMITSGVIEAKKKISIEEAYYERAETKSIDKTRPMRDFHKKIKGDMLFNAIRLLFKANKKGYDASTPYKPLLLDLACGVGGDVVRYFTTEPYAVLGIDVSKKNILNPDRSAYTYFLDKLQSMKPREAEAAPTMFFVLGDSSKRIKDGTCAIREDAVETDKLILQALFAQPQDKPIDYQRVVDNLGTFKGGLDAIVLMFAIHYFFESREKFEGLLNNINELLKVGGFFTGCNFDGETIMKFLEGREKRKGEVEIKKDKKETVWEITKKYSEADVGPGSQPFGHQIDVMFKSISERATPEYLVPWKAFVEAMKSIGCELLTEEEAKKVGLPASTQMFKTTYEALPEDKRPKMEPDLAEYSFLNRWWVFQRKSKGPFGTVAVAAATPVPEGEVVAEVPPPTVGVPEAVRVAKGAYVITDSSTVSKDTKQILLTNKIYETTKDIPKDLPIWLSPMSAFTYIYNPPGDSPEQKFSCFYHYFYARMIMESGDEDVKGIGAQFRVEGKEGRLLKASLSQSSDTDKKTTDIQNASKAAKKIADKLKSDKKLNSAWNPTQVVEDALRQRFTAKSDGKDLLCKLDGLVNFEYVTAIEPLIGKTSTGKGTNVYGEVLQQLAPDLCKKTV
jgi:hypothetical protein